MRIKFFKKPSYQALSAWIGKNGIRMSNPMYRLYDFIQNQARIEGYCYTSEATMAAMLEWGLKTVKRTLKRLEMGGWVYVDREINRVNKIYLVRCDEAAAQKAVFAKIKGLRRVGGGVISDPTPSGVISDPTPQKGVGVKMGP